MQKLRSRSLLNAIAKDRAARRVCMPLGLLALAGGASRMAGLLEQYKPAIVVIELGGNDGLRGTPLPTMREQLNQMVKRSRERKARVVELHYFGGMGHKEIAGVLSVHENTVARDLRLAEIAGTKPLWLPRWNGSKLQRQEIILRSMFLRIRINSTRPSWPSIR